METSLDTLTLAAEERAKQGIHELDISFGGELDLHKHFNNCLKNPGHPDFIPVNTLRERHLSKHRNSRKITEFVRQISDFTVKLSVNYVSPNRPPGYPLSDRGGQRALTVGSGYVTDFGSHSMTIVTAAHVVFDDEEAKHTTVEFFYDDPADRNDVVTVSGWKVKAFSQEADFCELLCTTFDKHLFETLIQKFCMIKLLPKIRLTCELFRSVLPGIESFQYDPGHRFQFFVKISSNHSWNAVEALTTLMEFIEDAIELGLNFWERDYSSLRDFLESSGLIISHMLNVFVDELCIEESVDDLFDTRLFSNVCITLWDLILTLSNMKFHYPQRCKNILLPLIKKLAKYQSTLESLEERLSLSKYFQHCCHTKSRDHETVVSIHDDIATVDISLSARRKRIKFDYRCGYARFLVHIAHPNRQFKHVTIERQMDCFTGDVFYRQLYTAFPCPGCLLEPEWMISASSYLSQVYEVPHSVSTDDSKINPDDSESKPDNSKSNPDDNESKPDDSKSNPHDSESKPQLRPESTIPASSFLRRFRVFLRNVPPDDSESKTDDTLLVHIAHPHGQSKHVTIGRQTDCFTGDGFYHQLYTAPTCPGCSGGPVWMIPASGDLSQVYGVPHSGCNGNQLSSGCSWTLYPLDLLVKDTGSPIVNAVRVVK